MANLITFIRLVMLFVIVWISLYADLKWQFLNVVLIIINILLDGLDGIVARFNNESSVFGAMFDIAVDRITELVFWFVLAYLQMVSIWIGIIFLTRGILVDSLRKPYADQGRAPFSIMQTKFGKFLVASRVMRFAIGFMKLVTFSWLFFLIPATKVFPEIIVSNHLWVTGMSNVLIYLTLAICLARGIPVVAESMFYCWKK